MCMCVHSYDYNYLYHNSYHQSRAMRKRFTVRPYQIRTGWFGSSWRTPPLLSGHGPKCHSPQLHQDIKGECTWADRNWLEADHFWLGNGVVCWVFNLSLWSHSVWMLPNPKHCTSQASIGLCRGMASPSLKRSWRKHPRTSLCFCNQWIGQYWSHHKQWPIQWAPASVSTHWNGPWGSRSCHRRRRGKRHPGAILLGSSKESQLPKGPKYHWDFKAIIVTILKS